MTIETPQVRIDQLIQDLGCCPHLRPATHRAGHCECATNERELADRYGYRPDGTRLPNRVLT